jgi:hypothetical protein
MSTGAVVLLVMFGVATIGAVWQLLFNDRSGSLDDSGSGPVPHRQRRSPGPDSGQRRDHDW